MRFFTLSLLACITGLTFCEVLEISSGITTCSELTSFLRERNFSELTILLVVIVSLTEVACIEAVGIKSTCIGDDSTRTVSIDVITNTSIKYASVSGTN